MKKAILILVAVLSLTSCMEATKYRIKSGSTDYATNSYQEVNGCVIFKNECGCGGEPKSIKVCGNYTIIKNNQNGQ